MQILQLVKALFHLALDPVAEGLNHGSVLDTLCFFLSNPFTRLFALPVLVEIDCDVEFDSVVSRRDRLDVPLHVVVLLDLLDVIDVVENEQRDEHCHASQEKGVFLADDNLVLGEGACNLDVDQTGRPVALFPVEAFGSLVDEPSEIFHLADLLAHALFLDIALELVCFEVAGALGRVGETVSRAEVAQFLAVRDDASVEDLLSSVLGNCAQVEIASGALQDSAADVDDAAAKCRLGAVCGGSTEITKRELAKVVQNLALGA